MEPIPIPTETTQFLKWEKVNIQVEIHKWEPIYITWGGHPLFKCIRINLGCIDFRIGVFQYYA